MAERGETIRIGSYDVKITRPDKVLFPDDRITKRDLITYYRRIAPWILPQLRGRPLTLERFPDGIDKTRIIQKASSSYNPAWVKTVTVKKVGGTVRHVVCENEVTLAYLANQACVTPHIWLSRSHRLDYPDQMVFEVVVRRIEIPDWLRRRRSRFGKFWRSWDCQRTLRRPARVDCTWSSH